MSRQRKEIECIERMQSLNGNLEDILEFLLSEAFITREELKAIIISSDKCKQVQGLLASLSETGKFQLLEYEWVILPIERIKIMIVTDRSSKEFTYNF